MRRLAATVALLMLLGTGTAVHMAERRHTATPDSSLDVPMTLASWHGTDAAPLDEDTRAAIAADQIVNRTYLAADGRAVGLYVAAYHRQRPGSSIHSPLHCLPGTGWSVLADDALPVRTGDGESGSLRRLVAVRERAKILVLYWYAIGGRLVASDLLSRAYLLRASLTTGHNGAALVRLVVPVDGDDRAAAERTALAFAETIAPHVTSTPRRAASVARSAR